MIKMMRYDAHVAELLQQIFRHKLVHTSEPRGVLSWRGDIYSWAIRHADPAQHLTIQDLGGKNYERFAGLKIRCDKRFSVSIMDFASDIQRSVVREGHGYLATLQQSPEARYKFERAMLQLCSPEE